MKLEWSVLALRDRGEIFDHIEAEEPRAAIAIDEAISRQVGRLSRFPESGRAGRIEGTREMVVAGTPYIVGYRVVRGGRSHSARSSRRPAMAGGWAVNRAYG